ncbi:MAG: hypothetical protein AAF901_12580 [Bacteroidota bacterium]
MGFVYDKLLVPIAITFIVIGCVASILNYYVVTSLFRRMDCLKACEMLIVVNCLLSGVYGHLLLFPASIILWPGAWFADYFYEGTALHCVVFILLPLFIKYMCLGKWFKDTICFIP